MFDGLIDYVSRAFGKSEPVVTVPVETQVEPSGNSTTYMGGRGKTSNKNRKTTRNTRRSTSKRHKKRNSGGKEKKIMKRKRNKTN
jgi:hypothetical protein